MCPQAFADFLTDQKKSFKSTVVIFICTQHIQFSICTHVSMQKPEFKRGGFGNIQTNLLCFVQKKYVKSRTDFRNIVNSLLEEHEAATEANLTETNGHAGSNQSGSKQSSMSGAKTVPEVRRGVKPGSFLDLLVQGGIRRKGSSFSHSIKAQQV